MKHGKRTSFWLIMSLLGLVLAAWGLRTEGVMAQPPEPHQYIQEYTGPATCEMCHPGIVDDVIQSNNPQGVVISDQAIVRKGNGDGFKQAFTEPLTEGVELTLVQVRPGWLPVELADGKGGWIPSKDVELVDRMDS